MKLSRLLGTLVVASGFAAAACGGGGGNYKVPVDSPLMVFTPPEESELTGEGGDDIDLTKPVEEEAPPPAEPPKPEPPKPAPPKPAPPKPAGGKPQ
jgi:hypothetical protein